jgi:hypothetical protein
VTPPTGSIACRGKQTALQYMELAWAKRGVKFERKIERGWTKLIAPAIDMVLIYKPDGTLHEQRTFKQEMARAASAQAGQ